MFSFKSLPGSARALLGLGCAALLAACASTSPRPSTHGLFRVTWTATRTADHTPLASASTVVAVGGSSTVHTAAAHPTEGKPAFPSFTVRLTARNASGVLQVVSRVSLLEAARNKKGKLKVTKRNIGALLPMRLGETQLTSVQDDPVHLEVHLERE